MRLLDPLFAMKPADGALPTLRAAVDPAAGGGIHWGPADFCEMNGPPVAAKVTAAAREEDVARKLFDVSEERVGLSFPRAATEQKHLASQAAS